MDNVRTCLGCRSRSDRSSLLRVVARNGEVVPDPSATLPGRGAWVHPTITCVESASRRRVFGRALRVTEALDLRHLTELVQQETVGVSSEIPQPKG
ncbi:YlxR family protein [Salinibacterium sp. G-O1]|uniref:YlxR family protein n=1 Tax=Salinibacterium sp. G-O1 TaxID=3046208 RepID=UPI0024B98675|nr:YlxR family protein [Salinibacterium sp. G-O1]MDJ0334730.1 YlxR family protein [Salinibacterium sp. G-O1]